MSSPLLTILQGAKLGYLGHLRRIDDRAHLATTRDHLDHFLHWTEACDIYRADQLGHQLIYDYQNHFDYQLYCVPLSRDRDRASLELRSSWRAHRDYLQTLRGWLFWLYSEGVTSDDLSNCIERKLSEKRIEAVAKSN